MSTPYKGSYLQYNVVRNDNVMVPMKDGVFLATDIYLPASSGRNAGGKFPVLLERTPYNKRRPGNVTDGNFFARRGYIYAVQDVRGRFQSEGEWYPFAKEAPDGYDTVEWLAAQTWSTGQVGTMGSSYSGSDQAALATLNPPSLCSMIVGVGASNYYHSSMRQNGALEQRFLIYAFRMAVTSKEAQANPRLKASLIQTFTHQMDEIVAHFPLREGSTILHRLPNYERWAIDLMTHGNYDDYWKQRGYAMSEYYSEHADVPTLYLGGWYDSYARNTCESFIALSKLKESDQRLLMGPWTHGGWGVSYAGEIDFGIDSPIIHNDLRLAWFDHYLKHMHTEVTDWSPVRIFTMGTGDGKRVILGAPGERVEYPGRINHGGYWRNESDWPLQCTNFTSFYLQGSGHLSPGKPKTADTPPTRFTFDPKHPVPTIGGGISAADPVMEPGAFDQRGRSDSIGCEGTLSLNSRSDVLTFETTILTESMEVTGHIEMHLWASSSAVDTDFTAKLIDVYPPGDEYPEGLAFNITDSIIRARYRDGWDKPKFMTPGRVYEFTFQLYPTSNVFKKGHRIRLDISSSNWPRFDVNPNTGGTLGLERTCQTANQAIYHNQRYSSYIILPIQNRK